MRKPLLVQNPLGEIQAGQVRSNINLVISMENFIVNLIVIESLDIPLVLGNGWLCAHKGVIRATQWKLFLSTPSGKIIEYQGGPLLPEDDDVALFLLGLDLGAHRFNLLQC